MQREQQKDGDGEQRVEPEQCMRAPRDDRAAAIKVPGDDADDEAVEQHHGDEDRAAEHQVGERNDVGQRQYACQLVDVGFDAHRENRVVRAR